MLETKFLKLSKILNIFEFYIFIILLIVEFLFKLKNNLEIKICKI